MKSILTWDKEPMNFVTYFLVKAFATWLFMPSLCTYTKLKFAKNSYQQAYLAVNFFWALK